MYYRLLFLRRQGSIFSLHQRLLDITTIFYIDNYKIEKSVKHMSKKTIPFEQASQTVRTQVIDIMQKKLHPCFK